MKKGMYEDNGIELSKSTPKVGDQVDIVYKGLLKESGARNVRLHMGYNEAWEDSQYIEMNLSDNIFMATIPLKKEGTLNFAFTDPVGNWDNNSGFNYSVRIAGTRSGKGASPMTGPYNSQPAGKKAAKAEITAKKDEETLAPVKKTTRTTASKTTDSAAKKASPPIAETPLETVKSTRGRKKAVQPMPDAIPAPPARGPGRRAKREP